MKRTVAALALAMSLSGCGGGGEPKDPGPKYWEGRQQMRDLAHAPRKPGGRSNFAVILLLLGCGGVVAARVRRL